MTAMNFNIQFSNDGSYSYRIVNISSNCSDHQRLEKLGTIERVMKEGWTYDKEAGDDFSSQRKSPWEFLKNQAHLLKNPQTWGSWSMSWMTTTPEQEEINAVYKRIVDPSTSEMGYRADRKRLNDKAAESGCSSWDEFEEFSNLILNLASKIPGMPQTIKNLMKMTGDEIVNLLHSTCDLIEKKGREALVLGWGRHPENGIGWGKSTYTDFPSFSKAANTSREQLSQLFLNFLDKRNVALSNNAQALADSLALRWKNSSSAQSNLRCLLRKLGAQEPAKDPAPTEAESKKRKEEWEKRSEKFDEEQRRDYEESARANQQQRERKAAEQAEQSWNDAYKKHFGSSPSENLKFDFDIFRKHQKNFGSLPNQEAPNPPQAEAPKPSLAFDWRQFLGGSFDKITPAKNDESAYDTFKKGVLNGLSPQDLLKLPQPYSEDDINKALKVLYLKLHPDRNPGNKDEATTLTQCLTEAVAKSREGLKSKV